MIMNTTMIVCLFLFVIYMTHNDIYLYMITMIDVNLINYDNY